MTAWALSGAVLPNVAAITGTNAGVEVTGTVSRTRVAWPKRTGDVARGTAPLAAASTETVAKQTLTAKPVAVADVAGPTWAFMLALQPVQARATPTASVEAHIAGHVAIVLGALAGAINTHTVTAAHLPCGGERTGTCTIGAAPPLAANRATGSTPVAVGHAAVTGASQQLGIARAVAAARVGRPTRTRLVAQRTPIAVRTVAPTRALNTVVADGTRSSRAVRASLTAVGPKVQRRAGIAVAAGPIPCPRITRTVACAIQ